MFFQTGDYASSLLNLNKAIELQPEYPDSYYNRGVIYVKNHYHTSALNDFRQYEKLKSKVTREPYLRILSHIKTGNSEGILKNTDDKTELVKELEELLAKLKKSISG